MDPSAGYLRGGAETTSSGCDVTSTIAPVCRVLAYLGQPMSLAHVLYETDSSLVRQTVCGTREPVPIDAGKRGLVRDLSEVFAAQLLGLGVGFDVGLDVGLDAGVAGICGWARVVCSRLESRSLDGLLLDGEVVRTRVCGAVRDLVGGT